MQSSLPNIECNHPLAATTRVPGQLRFLCAFALITLLGVLCRYSMLAVAADRDARNFIRLNGHICHEGYPPTFLARTEQRLLRRLDLSDFWGVVIPRHRMTDTMASHLLNMRNLRTIHLVPVDLHDGPNTLLGFRVKNISSLGELDLPIDQLKISQLYAQFPELRINLLNPPAENPAPASIEM